MAFICLSFLIVADAQHSVAAAPDNADFDVANDQGWKTLAARDRRILRIGDSIALASAPLCQGTGTLGFSIGNLADIDQEQWSFARAAYSDADGPVFITAVVPDGAAEHAGLEIGQTVTAIDSALLAGYSTEDIWKILGRVTVGSSVDITLGVEGTKTLEPVAACSLVFVADTSPKLTAGYDGTRIRLTGAIMDFASTDDELAAIIAHEASHAILCHNLRKRSKGRREADADRLSARIMMAAGFDTAGAKSFWQKFGKNRGLIDLLDWSHGSAATRIKRIEREKAAVLETSSSPILKQYAITGDCPVG